MTLTTVNPALLDTQAQYTGFKNRIINGDMRIDQRNAGAAVAIPNSTVVFITDRFRFDESTDGAFSGKQDTVAPAGFVNSLKLAVTIADASLGADQYTSLRHYIEGYNIADLGWGTVNAQTVTLSFWVRSSLTGTFGGSLRNNGGARSYPFTYTISAVDTWEQKTITVAGDTSGTWLTDNGTGIILTYGLGVGSTYSGAAGAWASANYISATGATSVVGTSGATFYITGVQLEKGSTATSFDYRDYGRELIMCQRYYFKTGPAAAGDKVAVGYAVNTTTSDAFFTFPVSMRTAPSALEQTGTAGDYGVQYTGNIVCSAVPIFQSATNQAATTRQTVASGLTTNGGNFARLQTTSGYFAWSAEL